MAGVLRGEIFWADLSPTRGHEQGGKRPVVVLSQDLFNERSQTVIVMPITSRPQRAGYPLTWRVPSGSLPKESWVKVSQLRTIAVDRLGARVARLDEKALSALVSGLLELIG